MSLTTLLYAYLLGGVTFLPLLLIAVVATAWFTSPKVHDQGAVGTKDDGANKDTVVDSKGAAQEDTSPDGAANATFAVLRSYNLQTALSTLNTKPNSASNGAGEGVGEGAGQESMSVYQSMYRSVFDRSKTPLQRKPLAEDDESPAGVQARAKAAAPASNIFHIVLRHGHLMLYDSPAELEVRHVISMAHHSVSLSDGDGDDEAMPDSDLFIKRTAILLKPRALSAIDDVIKGSSPQPKLFYLFSSNCSEKEDFYHALVAAQTESPAPQPLDSSCSIKLQSNIHSNSLTPETRAFNALINRVFLALHRTPFLEDLVRDKIEKKISRVAKPAFISYVNVQSIDLGDAGPILSNPRLKDINISGDMILSMDVKYTGGVKIVISAVAKLDLGQRFKVRTVDLVLAGSLQRLQGRMLVRVKPPPSNRIWFCFETLPDMEIKIEPVVSSRQITYNWILRTIENRIREVFAETLVKPNWDDIPFFDTHGQCYRGGIWQQQPQPDDEPSRTSTDQNIQDFLSSRNEKSMSMPNLADPSEGSATSSGAQTPVVVEQTTSALDPTPGLKHRSVTSLPSQAAQAVIDRVNTAPKAVRSPSFASPSASAPSVAVDGSNVDAFRGNEVPQATKRWIGRSSQPMSKRDAVEAIRQVKDRATMREDAGTPQNANIDASTATAEAGSEDRTAPISKEPDEVHVERTSSVDTKSSETLHVNASDESLPLPRTPDRGSFSRTDTGSSSATSSQNSQTRGKALFAATAAATSAARQWTLNAVANRNKGVPLFKGQAAQKTGPQEPVGRGQPLPPIGQPLPGPKTSLWGGSTFAGGNVKRKPVLPARRPTMEQNSTDIKHGEEAVPKEDSAAKSVSDKASLTERSSAEPVEDDEFGPWRDNFEQESKESGSANASERTDEHKPDSGASHKEVQPTQDTQPEQVITEKKEKTPPPPLPARRKRAPDLPKRPHERSESKSENPNPTPITQQEDGTADELRDSRASEPDPKNQPAIPAPANDEAEQRGVLELDEADGVHVIEAAVESGSRPIENTSSGRSVEGSRAKHVTMEEVPEDYT
jgi:hypothetical protein